MRMVKEGRQNKHCGSRYGGFEDSLDQRMASSFRNGMAVARRRLRQATNDLDPDGIITIRIPRHPGNGLTFINRAEDSGHAGIRTLGNVVDHLRHGVVFFYTFPPESASSGAGPFIQSLKRSRLLVGKGNLPQSLKIRGTLRAMIHVNRNWSRNPQVHRRRCQARKKGLGSRAGDWYTQTLKMRVEDTDDICVDGDLHSIGPALCIAIKHSLLHTGNLRTTGDTPSNVRRHRLRHIIIPLRRHIVEILRQFRTCCTMHPIAHGSPSLHHLIRHHSLFEGMGGHRVCRLCPRNEKPAAVSVRPYIDPRSSSPAIPFRVRILSLP